MKNCLIAFGITVGLFAVAAILVIAYLWAAWTVAMWFE